MIPLERAAAGRMLHCGNFAEIELRAPGREDFWI